MKREPNTYRYDFVIIGSGPNGLSLAAYLCKTGAKVLILDKSFEMGGGLATEDLTLPGFVHNSHSIYHMMVDYAPPYKDFQLEQDYDVHYAYPDLQFAMPLSDGRCICIYKDVERTYGSIREFSQHDADIWREIISKSQQMMDDYLAPASYVAAVPTLEQAAMFERSDFGRELMTYAEKSPREIVDELFENEHVKALMSYIICQWGLEYDQNGVGYLALLFLNRCTNYRLCIRGSHRVASALSRIIMENGGQMRNSVVVKRIIVKEGKACGVEMDDGTIYEAEKAVVSSIDPHQTFLKMIDRKELETEFAEMIEGWMWETWSLLSLHLAIDGRPNFTAASSNPDINKAFVYVLGYETVEDLVSHWGAIDNGDCLTSAGFNCCFPSIHDPIQASRGRSTGLISEMAPYTLKEGMHKWYDRDFREELARRHLQTLERYAPGIRDQVLWTFISTPRDIENKFPNMVKGSIKQGAYHPFQMGYNRPNSECSDHRTPIGHLYLCGASTHSGGMVTFGPGYVAANRIAEDFGIEKWWDEPEMITRAREKGML